MADKILETTPAQIIIIAAYLVGLIIGVIEIYQYFVSDRVVNVFMIISWFCLLFAVTLSIVAMYNRGKEMDQAIKERDRLKKEKDFYFRKTPENWSNDILTTDAEARASLRHVLDTVTKLDPELADGVLSALSKPHENIWLQDT